MKYFLCAFGDMYLGIPSALTERVVSAARTASAVFESDGSDVYISLPVLFGRADIPSPHGLVLKSSVNDKKVTLLAPSLDIDLEIPDEEIFSVPKVLSGVMRYCKGTGFVKRNSQTRFVLILDSEKLTEQYCG